MPTLTIRNLPEKVHLALKRRAVEHDNSTEEEVRQIIAAAVVPRQNLADMLLDIGSKLEGAELNIQRDKRPFKTEPLA